MQHNVRADVFCERGTKNNQGKNECGENRSQRFCILMKDYFGQKIVFETKKNVVFEGRTENVERVLCWGQNTFETNEYVW